MLLEQLGMQRTQIENQRKNLEQTKASLQDQKSDIDYITSVDFESHEAHTNYIDEIDTQIKSIDSKLAVLSQQSAEIDNAILSNQQIVFPQLKTLNKDLDKLRAEKSALKNQTPSIEDQISKLIEYREQLMEGTIEDLDEIDYKISELQQKLPTIENAIAEKESEIGKLLSTTPDEILATNSKTIDSIELQIDQLLAMDKALNTIDLEKSAEKSSENEILLSNSIDKISASIYEIDPSADKKRAEEKEKKKTQIKNDMSKARKGINDFNSKRKTYANIQNNIFNSLQAISDIINPEIGNDLKNYDEFNKILNISVLKPYLDDYLKRLGQSLNEDNPIIDNWQNLTLIFPNSDTLRIGNIDKTLKDINEFSTEIDNILKQISEKTTSQEQKSENKSIKRRW